MNRILVFTTAFAIAGVPAAIGLAGNSSFSQGVAVRVPAQATLSSVDGGHSTHAEPGDDSSSSVTPSTEPSPRMSTDDNGGQAKHVEPGDDNGTQAKHPEPGDDERISPSSSSRSSDDGTRQSTTSAPASATASPTDDKGGHSGGGSDDGSGHQ